MNTVVVVVVVVVLLVVFFANSEAFTVYKDSEFKGINMLGVNTNDVAFPAQSAQECEKICERNTGCNGYGFYEPAQKCYLYLSGGIVPNRPGFTAGIAE